MNARHEQTRGNTPAHSGAGQRQISRHTGRPGSEGECSGPRRTARTCPRTSPRPGVGSGVSDDNKTAEWNIYLDPLAARLVFESGAPITLVPLDATNDAPVTPDFMKTLEANQTSPESKFLYAALSTSSDSIAAGTYFFWDPLAAAVLADPSLVTLTDRMVDVMDAPGPDFGRTKPVGNGPHIQVATKPDDATFEQHLLDAWNS